jgi:hypothetical protein
MQWRRDRQLSLSSQCDLGEEEAANGPRRMPYKIFDSSAGCGHLHYNPALNATSATSSDSETQCLNVVWISAYRLAGPTPILTSPIREIRECLQPRESKMAAMA